MCANAEYSRSGSKGTGLGDEGEEIVPTRHGFKTTPTRSKVMGRIKGTDSKPEVTLRKALWRRGYRYRKNYSKLPGKPDLAFPGRKKVVFVHGCFWHQHGDPGCRRGGRPKSNLDYWMPKLERNVARDRRNQEELKRQGWDVLVVWECELKDLENVEARVAAFLDEA